MHTFRIPKLFSFAKKHKGIILLFFIFIIHIFLRFYQLESRFSFGYDQVDSAWAAKRIIDDHNFPVLGPSNKLGSGIFIGPLYYYLISIFYFFTNLDPVAAPIFAGATSIFSFFILFFITKKLFTFNTALLAVFINTVSNSGIEFDRMQWEINFIPGVALIGFYALYKIVKGEEKFLLLLGLASGLAINIHLTIAVFMPIITVLLLPFFPKTKKTIKYSLMAILLFFIFLSPLILANFQTKNDFSGNVFQYINEAFHGLHLTRVVQLTYSAMYEIESFFTFSWLRNLSLITVPLFLIIYFFKKPSKKTLIFCYLVVLWFIVPWFVLSTYNGEITNYYFSTTRFVGLSIISYLVIELLKQKKLLITLFFVIFGVHYSISNLQKFFSFKGMGLISTKASVMQTIKEGKVVKYKEGYKERAGEFYLFHIYTRKNKR